jgi:hypothetical protein
MIASKQKTKAAGATYKGRLNYDFLRRDNQDHLSSINNIFIETELCIKGLRSVLKEVISDRNRKVDRVCISAPTVKGKIGNISRKIEVVIDILNQRIATKEYLQSLVFAVSLTEDYMARTLVRVIRAYPKKLLISVKGNALRDEDVFPIDMRDVIRLQNVDNLILEKANQRVRDAMYGSPSQYFSFQKSVLGFGLPEFVWRGFVEIKATRDLYIHGDGRVNEIYIRKAGNMARAKIGEVLTIDSEYLNKSITCMKSIITATYKGLRSSYVDSQELNRILQEQ